MLIGSALVKIPAFLFADAGPHPDSTEEGRAKLPGTLWCWTRPSLHEQNTGGLPPPPQSFLLLSQHLGKSIPCREVRDTSVCVHFLLIFFQYLQLKSFTSLIPLFFPPKIQYYPTFQVHLGEQRPSTKAIPVAGLLLNETLSSNKEGDCT